MWMFVSGDRRMSQLSGGCHHSGCLAHLCREHGSSATCSSAFLHLQDYRRVSWCRSFFMPQNAQWNTLLQHFVNRFATLSPENRRNIHVARTALREACLLTLYDHAQRFHCDQRCHLWLTGDEFRICAASIWFISERVRPCGSKC